MLTYLFLVDVRFLTHFLMSRLSGVKLIYKGSAIIVDDLIGPTTVLK